MDSQDPHHALLVSPATHVPAEPLFMGTVYVAHMAVKLVVLSLLTVSTISLETGSRYFIFICAEVHVLVSVCIIKEVCVCV